MARIFDPERLESLASSARNTFAAYRAAENLAREAQHTAASAMQEALAAEKALNDYIKAQIEQGSDQC